MSELAITKAEAKRALLAVKNKFQKKYGRSFLDASEKREYSVVSTGSAIIDDATGIGGLARGKCYEISGLESSGKSSICYSICAMFQKAYPNQYVAYIDPEQAINTKYMESFGMDTSEDALIIASPEIAEEGMQMINDLAETGACSLIIYDSVPSAPTKAQVEKQFDENTMGELARLLSKSVPDIKNAAARTDTTVIFINQLRTDLGAYMGPLKTPGGKALPYYCSMRLLIKKKEPIMNSAKQQIGQDIEINFKKNKVGTPYQIVTTKLYYGKGFDFENEYSEIAVKLGLIEKGGAWFSWNDSQGIGVKKQGILKVVDYFKENPEEFTWLKQEIEKKQKEGLTVSPVEIIDLPDDEIPEEE